jgi:Chlorophyll A-B binding protein
MLAIVGHMTTAAGFRFPGCEAFPAGAKALTAIDPVDLFLPILAIGGFLDVAVMKDVKGTGVAPGDFRNGMFKWDVSEAEQREKLSIELNNGRAAQMGIMGLVVHEQLTGEPYVLNAFLGYPTHFNEGF